jgi:WD40 repeat protein
MAIRTRSSKLKELEEEEKVEIVKSNKSTKRKASEQQEDNEDTDTLVSNKMKASEDNEEKDFQDNSISEYERIRLENIKRNEMFLSDLGVSTLRSSLNQTVTSSSSQPKRKKMKTGLTKAVAQTIPTRRSTRVTVDKLSSEIKLLKVGNGNEELIKSKEEELEAMIKKQKEGSYIIEAWESTASAENTYVRIEEEHIPLTKLNNFDFEVENESDKVAVMKMEEEKNKILEDVRQLFIMATFPTVHYPNSFYAALEDSKPTNKKGQKFVSAVVKQEKSKEFLDSTAKQFAKLKLDESDVQKMTPQRITSVALHPSEQKIIAVAGDKNGYIGIWDVTRSGTTNSDSGGEVYENIVYQYRPHISNVIQTYFRPEDSNLLVSISYDGTIRQLDLQHDSWNLAFEAPESLSEIYFSDGCLLSGSGINGNSAFSSFSALISKSTGYISLIDFRASSKQYQWSFLAQDARINSLQQHPTLSHLVVTAGSKGGGIAVHDIRQVSSSFNKTKAIAYHDTQHSKSINAAYISPDGEYLVSVSQDDTVKTWKGFVGGKDEKLVVSSLKHNNFTGRWLSTFRPSFDPKRAHTLVLGSMLQPRRLEILQIQSNNSSKDHRLDYLCNLEGGYLASVNSRNCFHPTLEIVLGGNSSGKVHLFR